MDGSGGFQESCSFQVNSHTTQAPVNGQDNGAHKVSTLGGDSQKTVCVIMMLRDRVLVSR